MHKSNYLSLADQGINLNDYCLSSNYDEDLGNILPKIYPNQLLKLVSLYNINLLKDLTKKISLFTKTNRIVLGAGSEELVVRTNNLIKNNPVGMVTPGFYRTKESYESNNNNKIKLISRKDLLKPFEYSYVWISNPSLIDGEVFTTKELLKIIKIHPKTIFLVDEAGVFLLPEWQKYSLMTVTKDASNFVVYSSFSKLFGLSGQRVGFASGNRKILNLLEESGPTFPITNLSAVLAKTFVDKVRYFDKIVQKIQVHKQEVENLINENSGLQIRKTKLNFVLIKDTDNHKFSALLSKNKILALDTSSQEGVKEGWIRITIHSSEDKHVFLKRKLSKVLEQL